MVRGRKRRFDVRGGCASRTHVYIYSSSLYPLMLSFWFRPEVYWQGNGAQRSSVLHESHIYEADDLRNIDDRLRRKNLY